MDLSLIVCQLIPAGGSHSLVNVENVKPLVIGRNPLVSVTDRKCSREQMEVCADYSKKELHITHLGFHPSRVATKLLKRGDTYTLGAMGWFELLDGKYRYHVHFGAALPETKPGAASVSANLAVEESMEREVEPPAEKKLKLMLGEDSQMKLKSFASKDPHSLACDSQTWREFDSLLVFQYGTPPNSPSIAAFDLDNTIIETASGRRFATGPTDWRIMKKVVEKLKSYSNRGFKIVLLSNQLGISKGKPTKGEFQHKVESIVAKLSVPLLLLASLAKDAFRKPCIGMWDHLAESENGDMQVDVKSSFFVGDAAGREDAWSAGKKKDFSCTDRKFAANIGLPFFTPEEFFLDSPQCKRFNWGAFDPRKLLSPEQDVGLSETQEMVMFVGYPASGKTTFFKKYLEPQGYSHVNRDTLGSWQKCVVRCTELLKSGKKVAIDNTSPDKESRKRYIDVAKKCNVPVRCFQFMTSMEHAKHNNRFRELTEGKAKASKHGRVNDMVFNMYKSKFMEPCLDEGFSGIERVQFVPSFRDKKFEKLYHQFLD